MEAATDVRNWHRVRMMLMMTMMMMVVMMTMMMMVVMMTRMMMISKAPAVHFSILSTLTVKLGLDMISDTIKRQV